MAGAFDAQIDISTAQATANLRALNKEVGTTATMLGQLDKALKETQGDLTKTAQALTQIVAAQRTAAKGSKDLANAQIAQARAEGIAITNANKVAESNARVAASEAQRQRTTVLTQQAIERKAAADAKAAQQADKTADAVRRSNESLSDSRYLLYDVGATYGVLSAAMLSVPIATAAIATAYQKDFAQVVRTTGTADAATGELRDSLKALTGEIPLSFEQLSGIASLGGQLGIAKDRLDEFTEVTAKFVATTNLTEEAAGTLFGRLSDTFGKSGDVEFFNQIGSSIAEVGVNSVATETEIAALLNQIGSIGAAAGFSAQSMVGMSGALASLRVRPELARGVLTTVFSDLNRAAESGGPQLQAYAEQLGMTQQAAANLWKSNPEEFFNKLVASLGEANKAGELTSTLDDLGIAGLRAVPMFTKLAVGADLFAEQMQTANSAYSEGTALNEMSAGVFETVAAKLTTLANSFKNLADSIGGSSLAPIGILIGMLQGLVDGLTWAADTIPGVKQLFSVLMLFSAVTGVFLGLKAAQAFVLAGLVGFQQVAGRSVIASSMSLTGIIRQLGITFMMMSGQSREAATSLLGTASAMQVTSTAARSLTATTVASGAALGTRLAGGAKTAGAALLGLAGGPVGIAVAALAALSIGMMGVNAKANQMKESVADAFNESDVAGAKALAEALSTKPEGIMADMANNFATNGKSVADIAKDWGVGLDTLTDAARGSAPALDEVHAAMDRFAQGKGFDGYEDLMGKGKKGLLFTPDSNGAYSALKQVEGALGDYKAKADETKQTSTEVEQALSNLGLAGEESGDGISVGTEAIDGMSSALSALMDQIFGVLNNEVALNDALRKVGEGLADTGSYDPASEGGGANIANFQAAAEAAQQKFMDLAIAGEMTTGEAAAQYAAFIDGLIEQIRQHGGDPTPIVNLAEQTKAGFENALNNGIPAAIPVTADASDAKAELASIEAEYGTLDATVLVEEHGAAEAAARVNQLQGVLGAATDTPYVAAVGADTTAANANASATQLYILSMFGLPVYTATVDADASPAVQALQGFMQWAQAGLSSIANAIIHVGNAASRVFGGAGDMGLLAMPAGPAPNGSSGRFGAPAKSAAPVAAAPAPPAQVAPKAAPKAQAGNFGAMADGYDKAAAAANKAGGAGKKAGDAGKKAGEETAKAWDDAAKEIESYAGRISTSLKRSFDQQYGLQSATDEYYTALNSIKKKRDEELKTVQELVRKQKELNNERNSELVDARKAQIERDISLKYGEGDRAADYDNQAQTSLDNAAAKQVEIETAKQEQTELENSRNKLVGYSQAAIDNRAALRDLESKMMDMIVAYANTGASQNQVEAYARKLTAQFNTQVGQIGYNRAAVNNLTGDTGRYIAAINRVPYRIHTESSNNFNSAAGQAGGLGNAIGGIPNYIPITADFKTKNYAAFMGPLGAALDALDRLKNSGSIAVTGDRRWFNQGGSVGGGFGGAGSSGGFYNGGLIPGQSPSNPNVDNLMASVDGHGAIRVRSGEFIQPEPAVNFYGEDFMNKIRTMSLPRFNMGGSVGGYSAPSAGAGGTQTDVITAEVLAALQRLAERPINLLTESTLLASTVSEGNSILASNGAN